MSRQLKLMARELNIPVVALSQLNRGLEARNEKRPTLSDLRESGALEQDADIVMFIYRHEVYEGPPNPEAEIIVSKHRNGPLGVAKVNFLADYATFVDRVS